MTPYKQLFRHKPEEGVFGDCFRTVIGCLLDLAPADVPHFADGGPDNQEIVDTRANEWLAQFNLRLVDTVYEGDVGDLKAVLNCVAHYNPNLHYILAGVSRTGVPHCVICLNDQIVHDPSLTNSGIVGPTEGYYWISFLALQDPAKAVTEKAAGRE